MRATHPGCGRRTPPAVCFVSQRHWQSLPPDRAWPCMALRESAYLAPGARPRKFRCQHQPPLAIAKSKSHSHLHMRSNRGAGAGPVRSSESTMGSARSLLYLSSRPSGGVRVCSGRTRGALQTSVLELDDPIRILEITIVVKKSDNGFATRFELGNELGIEQSLEGRIL